MAEIVGTVASGIGIATLAVQIAKSVSRLKSCWDEIRDAPAEITVLIEEIEIFQLLLEDIQDDQHQNGISSILHDSAGTSKCVELCRKGASALQEVAEDFDIEIRTTRGVRQKWASTKYVFRKDKVERHRARLDRAVKFLNLAYQIYTRDLLRLQPQVIVAQLRNMATVERALVQDLTEDLTDTTSVQSIGYNGHGGSPKSTSATLPPRRATRRNHTKKQIMRYRLQTRFLNSAWEFILAKSLVGWDIKLRSYSIRPRESDVFKMIEQGDINGLQDLFQRGLASPLDITEWGQDTMSLAMMFGQVETYRFLVHQGAETGKLNHDQMPYHLRQLLINGICADKGSMFFMEIIDILTIETHVNLDEYEILFGFRGPPDVFAYIKKRVLASGNIPTTEICLKVATRLAYGAPFNNSNTVSCALPSGKVSPTTAKFTTSDMNLLHGVAYAIGLVSRHYKSFRFTRSSQVEDLIGWRNLFQELLANGASPFTETSPRILNINPIKRSCFLRLFQGHLQYYIEGSILGTLSKLPRLWAEELERGGFDLLECGQTETELHVQNPESRKFLVRWSSFDLLGSRSCKYYEMQIYGFTFGLSPSDWHVYFSDPRDAFVGEFWDLIEPPELSIPGMWID